MTTLTSSDRVDAWNIWIVGPPPSNDLITGVFQSIQSPFLSWRDLFEDLLLCFDLESAVISPLGQLTLWNRNEDDHTMTSICFSTDESDSNMLSAFIRVGNRTDGSDSRLTLTLVLHDLAKCQCTTSCLADHLSSACATPLELARNPRIFFFPIPSGASSGSSAATPREFDQTPPNKRSYNSLAVSSQGQSPRNMCQDSPASKLTMPANLDLEVKKLYKGRCAISGNSSSWGSMISGPGLECAHLFPKALFEWYNYPDASSHNDKWLAVNNFQNCILMDSFCHRIHDNRLLAVHPDTHRVRFFAPIFPLIQRNHASAFFPDRFLPWETSLKWHYETTVVENMWAIFLWKDGGSKRFAWLGGPRPVLMKEAERHLTSQRNNFGALPGPSIMGVADCSGVTEGSVQEGTDCVVAAFHNKSLPSTSYSRKRSISSSSADIDMETQHDFSTKLIGLLEEEARSEYNLEKVLQWAKNCQWKEDNVNYRRLLLK